MEYTSTDAKEEFKGISILFSCICCHLISKSNELLAEEIKQEHPVEIPVESTREYKNSKPEITISNVVCNYRCRTHLNLREIALKTKHVIYKRYDSSM